MTENCICLFQSPAVNWDANARSRRTDTP